MKNNSKILLITLFALSVFMAVYEGFLFINGLEISHALYTIWGFVFIILMVLWIDQDSNNYPYIYRPFEYGFIVFIYYIPYLPYYLIKTRGVIGMLYLVGFFLLFNAGLLVQWLIYWVG